MLFRSAAGTDLNDLQAEVTANMEKKKGYARLQLSNPPEWVTLKTRGLSLDADWSQTVQFEVSEEAPPGAFESLVLNGIFTLTIAEDDPNFNPLSKWKNRINYNFTVGAVPVQITD